MILSIWEGSPGCYESTIERIVWIVHLVAAEDFLQAVLVKGFVMGYKRQSRETDPSCFFIAEGYQLFNLLPYFREDWSIFCISSAKSMYACAKSQIIIWFWLHKRIKRIANLSVFDNYNTDAANTCHFKVCRLKIYGRKIFHFIRLDYRIWAVALAAAGFAVGASPDGVELLDGRFNEGGFIAEDTSLKVAVVGAFHAKASASEVG